MIDTDTPKAPALVEYSAFVSRLLANKLHSEVVPSWLLLRALKEGLHSKGMLDQVKKGLFYGKDSLELSRARAHPVAPPYLRLNEELSPVVHAVLGLRTEVDELMELLVELLTSAGSITESKLLDEAGDVAFYLQALLGGIRKDLGDALENNTVKLNTRFPSGFDAKRAQNPDKAAEAAAVAGE